MIAPFVVISVKLFNKGMALYEHDGNKPCPQGVLFITTKDKDSPSMFVEMEQAQRAVEQSVLWGERQNYGWEYSDYAIISIVTFEQMQADRIRGFKKKPKKKKEEEH